jgi:hypothetical protein
MLIKFAVLIGSEFMSTSTRTEPLNLIVMSALSNIIGVSFKQVLANFVHGTVRYSVQNKVVSHSKIGYNSSSSTYFEMYIHVVCMVTKHIVVCVGSTSMCVV